MFATWAIFPFLHSLVGERDSTNKEVFTWIGGKEAEQRGPLLLWAIEWAKGFYFGPGLGKSLPDPGHQDWSLLCTHNTGHSDSLCGF